MSRPDTTACETQTPIAIIGMGCLFPGSSNVKEFWRFLRAGEDGITDVPATHWRVEDYFDADPKRPDMTYCRRGGFLAPTPFDPIEFGIPPTALEATDTTQLLGLIVAKQAMEDAGYGEERSFDHERTGVILGVTGTQELVLPLSGRLGHPIWRRALREAGVAADVAEDVVSRISDGYVPWQENSFPGLLGNVVAGRIANRLNLRGTNCVVDAACASALSAIHLASMELAAGRSDMVLTGGVDALNDIFMYMCFSKTPALSPTGDSRPFSADADGTVLGEGLGMVVLKTLADAERDGDRVYAVIRGIGTSSDGRSQSIYAPHAAGQARALRDAYRRAGVDPATVELIEAHGTGTKVGDAVEFEALRTVFREARDDGTWCGIGSVKSQIGHTKAAAGAAGLIKAALAVHHGVLPPTIKVDQPNPRLKINGSPFYVNAEPRPWMASENHPRRAGVSSFGFGGSNFHLVIEEHPAGVREPAWDGSVEIVAWSAETASALADQVSGWLGDIDELQAPTAALARRAAASRREFSSSDPHRLVLVVERGADLRNILETARRRLEAIDPDGDTATPGGASPNACYGGPTSPGKIAALFPGQGSQYVNMGRDLAGVFPEVAAALAELDADAKDDPRISSAVYPPAVFDEESRQAHAAVLTRTDIAQPAIGAISRGMTEIIRRFGFSLDAAAGHSYGELTALWAAGRMDVSALNRLSRIRGRLMAEGDGGRGAMLAVQAPLADVENIAVAVGREVVLANRNAPTQGVLSGRRDAIDDAATLCEQRGYRCRRLPVGGAFHSGLMASARAPFRKALDRVRFERDGQSVYSNGTGAPFPAASGELRELLADQIVRPIDFVGAIEGLYDAGVRTFVEIGPKAVLTGLVRAILGNRPHVAAALDRSGGRRGSGIADLARLLARLAATGHDIDLTRWERPAPAPRNPKMTVPLLGANYRSARGVEDGSREVAGPRRSGGVADRGAVPSVSRTSASDRWKDIEDDSTFERGVGKVAQTHDEYQADGVDDGMIGEPAARGSTASNESSGVPAPPEVLAGAMQAVQEGLRAMQNLQERTAAAHERFLQGQETAQQAFLRLIESQQRLLHGQPAAPMSDTSAPSTPAGPVALSPTGPGVPIGGPAVSTDAVMTPQPRLASPETAGEASTAEPDTGPVEAPAVTAAKVAGRVDAPASEMDGTLESLVLEVVGEKTGYPVDMIELDMDIEADLGIDSIKRVEIVAAIEERAPNLTSVQPEHMGGIRTLREIIRFMSAGEAGADGGTNAVCDGGSIAATVEFGGPVPMPAGGDERSAEVAALSDVLLSVVSELTGYPSEMLDLDLDMEADLGIDSIKRVEILAAVESRAPAFRAVDPEYLGSLRTLRQVLEYGSSGGAAGGSAATPSCEGRSGNGRCSPHPKPTNVDEDGPEGGSPPPSVERRVLTCASLPDVEDGEIQVPAVAEIRVTDDGAGLARAVVDALAARGQAARVVSGREAGGGDGGRPVGGLICIAPPGRSDRVAGESGADSLLLEAFELARRTGPALMAAAKNGGALFATVSRLDGGFGLVGGRFDPTSGGLAGLAKTAGQEWPGVRCRAIDVAADWGDIEAAAAAIVRELTSDGPLEVGLDRQARRGLQLIQKSISRSDDPPLAEGDVVLVSGGARGVAAEAAVTLAARFRPTLVLLGRSPAPTAEPDWLDGLTDEARIKRRILSRQYGGTDRPKPAELEAVYRGHMANREIRSTLRRIEATGARAIYQSVDVRQASAVQAVVGEVRAKVGAIRGLIHAAGVIEDRRIVDKTPEQFRTVYETKVAGLRNLVAATERDELKSVCLFSSVSARFGNAGQVDYAMANEVMNKIAHRLAATRPACRVVSINWGPWDGGMVGPDLRRSFERRGVGLIPLETGAACMVNELYGTDRAAVEVVIGSGFEAACEAAGTPSGTSASAANPARTTRLVDRELAVVFERELDVERHPFLSSHVLAGRPVLPVVMMMEWMGHAALHANPGLVLRGFDDLQVLQGVVLNGRSRTIRLAAGRIRRAGSSFEVDVELRGGPTGATETVHARARAILAPDHSPAPAFESPPGLAARPYDRGVDGAYEAVLFHGPRFRGLETIEGLSGAGIVASVRAAPPPSEWMSDALRAVWLCDPLVLDGAFQLAIIWCHEELGALSLPSRLAEYRQYARSFPSDGATIALRVSDRGRHRMCCDIAFVDRRGGLIAEIRGYECTVDASLEAAFREDVAAGA